MELGGINHKEATQHKSQVNRYIQRELQLGAVIGPFENIPFKQQVAISPISTRPKKDSPNRRIILDCSWPIRASLNDGINKDMYLGNCTNLKYPTIDKVCRKIFELHQSEPALDIYLFREDLDRAFCQLFAEPGSVPLLGYRWRNVYYFDVVMVMDVL